MPLKPGPRRYPDVEIKHTTPASPSTSTGVDSHTFHVAHRQKYT